MTQVNLTDVLAVETLQTTGKLLLFDLGRGQVAMIILG